MAAWHLPPPRLHGRSGRKRPSSPPPRPPPLPPWPAKEARRPPSRQLITPRRLIERCSRRRAPVQDPPWIWREAANDGPPGAAPKHQRGTQPLPPPDQADDDDSNPSPSPPRPARSGKRGAMRSSREMTMALLQRSVEKEAPWTPATGAKRDATSPRPALDLAAKPELPL